MADRVYIQIAKNIAASTICLFIVGVCVLAAMMTLGEIAESVTAADQTRTLHFHAIAHDHASSLSSDDRGQF